MKRIAILWSIVLFGCANPLDIELVPIDVTGDPSVSPAVPGEFRVSVENRGTQEVAWGLGSSSCQLGLAVIVDDERVAIGARVCTADLTVHALDPGGTRSEVIVWGGEVPAGNAVQPLPAGRYRVVGVAGSRAVSRPIWVEVREP